MSQLANRNNQPPLVGGALSRTDGVVVVLASELIPAWCVHFPASANKLDANLESAAQIYADHLSGKGVAIVDIRAASRSLIDFGGDFAPTPGELLAEALRAARLRQSAQTASKGKPQISAAAIRMIAEGRQYQENKPTSGPDFDRLLTELTQDYLRRGVTVTGGLS